MVPIKSIYYFLILRILLDGTPKAISDVVKLISMYKKKDVPFCNVKNVYNKLFRYGYVDYDNSKSDRKHKYLKITPEGKKIYLELEKDFIEDFMFRKRVYDDAVINKPNTE